MATPSIDAKRKEHTGLLAELELIQSKETLKDDEAILANKKAEMALQLQKDIDSWDAREAIIQKGREIRVGPLPTGSMEEKQDMSGTDVAGYMTVGDYFVAQREFKAFQMNDVRETRPFSIARMLKGQDGNNYLPISRAERYQIQSKASDLTLGGGVIDPMRLPEIVRKVEFDQLTLLGLVNTSPATSSSITYRRIASFTRAAVPVAESALKPPAAASVELITWNVFTHGVTMTVTEQQLADAAQVVNEINTHLLYDLDKLTEEQMTYGPGGGQNHLGFFADPLVLEARSQPTDNLIDRIRRAITDIIRDGYNPNAVFLDPLDWEAIELQKIGASDDRYVWAIVRDQLGPRIWSIRVVQGKSAENSLTGERNILVGDFARGATRWVREAVSIAMGWVNEQFTHNERTIRAENRDAFGITRPNAFRKIGTEAGS